MGHLPGARQQKQHGFGGQRKVLLRSLGQRLVALAVFFRISSGELFQGYINLRFFARRSEIQRISYSYFFIA